MAPGFDYVNWKPYGHRRGQRHSDTDFAATCRALGPYVHTAVVSGCMGREERLWTGAAEPTGAPGRLAASRGGSRVSLRYWGCCHCKPLSALSVRPWLRCAWSQYNRTDDGVVELMSYYVWYIPPDSELYVSTVFTIPSSPLLVKFSRFYLRVIVLEIFWLSSSGFYVHWHSEHGRIPYVV